MPWRDNTQLWKHLKTLPLRITKVTIRSFTLYRRLHQLNLPLILQCFLSTQANEYSKFVHTSLACLTFCPTTIMPSQLCHPSTHRGRRFSRTHIIGLMIGKSDHTTNTEFCVAISLATSQMSLIWLRRRCLAGDNENLHFQVQLSN